MIARLCLLWLVVLVACAPNPQPLPPFGDNTSGPTAAEGADDRTSQAPPVGPGAYGQGSDAAPNGGLRGDAGSGDGGTVAADSGLVHDGDASDGSVGDSGPSDAGPDA